MTVQEQVEADVGAQLGQGAGVPRVAESSGEPVEAVVGGGDAFGAAADPESRRVVVAQADGGVAAAEGFGAANSPGDALLEFLCVGIGDQAGAGGGACLLYTSRCV